jgi:hypothetical protein
MLRPLIITVLLLACSISHGQYMVKGELDPLWPLQIQYEESGWFLAPGMTRTFTMGQHQERIELDDGSQLDFEATPVGKYGVFFEVGRYRLLPDWLYFEHWDYSLAFKQLKGRESLEGTFTDASNGTVERAGVGIFDSYYVSANANLNHWSQVTDRGFIRASVGVNADYRVIDNTVFEGKQGPREPELPPEFIGQFHFKLGYGWKVSQKWFVIPTLETPVLNVYPWEGTVSSIEAFSSRYQPVILSLRFLIRDKLPKDECPPVPGGTDSEMNKQKLEKGSGNGGRR